VNSTDIFSEYGLIRHRVHVEIQWLKFLFRDLELETVNERAMGKIASIAASFNHDVGPADQGH
jgi:adenylosuccinate lyase